MSFKKFLFSVAFLKNFFLSIVILIVLVFLTIWGLKRYTDHGKAYTVPDFTGLTSAELLERTVGFSLRFKVIDSVYVNDAVPGSIVDQIPKPGFKVKENRTIFFTINASSPEQVILPKLRGISFRQSKVLIENCGLEVGKIIHQPSEFNDLVLSVSVDSIEVFKGDKYAKGTPIDFIVGKTSGFEKTAIPDILGKGVDEAKVSLNEVMLNLGVVIYDETILTKEDTLNSIIYKQRPNPKYTPEIDPGASVDVWATIDKLKVSDAINETL